ncbi:MAG: (5-formylfuran-3-yl)methyl phosphate synthase [Methylotenera sp.]|uniref:(5-formylfuran-3-yl)methyl phosphate synthase n=1 Tax=Methylotenera sp. TaxID=2051956 RepID=UPI0024884C5C|nr:(5-formylfuran-3-yl)methyl phosphate synthase [Methylotenera sp.]MDI1308091.1 (5-formylfuran-3-yl)methyl phosphate synthase [Methylotenera sp.]
MNAPINTILNETISATVNHAQLIKTQLLISVTTTEEAQIALENGADIIDLKEPSLGALGALPIATIQTIVTYVKNTKNTDIKLTSATIGDLPMEPELLLAHVAKLAATGVDIIKIGFFETDDYQPCLERLKSLTQAGVRLMAVFFAEITYPQGLIAAIKHAGFMGIMLDTANKNGLTLLDYYSYKQRVEFAEAILGHDLQFGLAGSLKLQHVTLIKELNPTYIGFRGGVCDDNQRNLALDAARIKAVRQMV